MPQNLDRVIIVDTSGPQRVGALRYVASTFARNIEIVPASMADLTLCAREFSSKLIPALREGASVMVVCNVIAGLRGGVARELLTQEDRFRVGTRRIMVTCNGNEQLKAEFNSFGILRDKFFHVRYDDDGRYLEKFHKLFT